MNPLRRARRSTAGIVLIVVLAAVVGACAGPVASVPSVTVADAWIRPAGAGATTAAYLTITNAGPAADTLLAVHCTIAGSAMLHQTSTDASGMTGMSMVDSLPVPPGGSVSLQPGGMHVMLTDLTRPILAGEKIEIELVFEHAGTIRVPAPVRAS